MIDFELLKKVVEQIKKDVDINSEKQWTKMYQTEEMV